MKTNALNDTKTPELSKSAEGKGNICDVCGIYGIEAWIKSKSPNGKTGLKNHANIAQK